MRSPTHWSTPLALLALLLATSVFAAPLRHHGARAPRPAPPPPRIVILCYHDLTDDPDARPECVPADSLRTQIRACKAAGWTFVSLAELLAHADHLESLPRRTMVMTFDDGYASFTDQALPILREALVPVTLAVITSFVDEPPTELPPLMTWEQIRQADSSGVEIASHTHDLHRYITSNPFRDTAPAVTTRRYLVGESRYETRAEYLTRVRDDLMDSQRALTERLGASSPVLVWPYGERNDMASAIAADAGFTTTLALGGREVTARDFEQHCLPRVMMTRSMAFGDTALGWLRPPSPAVRAASVDIDSLYDRDLSTFRRTVDAMVARAQAIGATHVILQACSDSAGDGRASATWFMNHQVPVRADLWSMVAAKLAQAGLKVWVRAPSLNLSWLWDAHPEWRIPYRAPRGAERVREPFLYRVSPELADVHRAAIDFYSDLAVYLPVSGVLFDRDAAMVPGESLVEDGATDPARKAAAIDDLLDHLREAVRAWRPDCVFARAIDEAAVERAGVDPGSAQDFDRCLAAADFVAVRPMAERRALEALAGRALARAARGGGGPAAGARVMLMLPGVSPDDGHRLGADELRSLADGARRAGIVSLGLEPLVPYAGELPDDLLETAGAPAPPPPHSRARHPRRVAAHR